MKSFLKMLLASCLGVFLAMFLVWAMTIGILVAVLSNIGNTKNIYTLSDNTVLQLDLDGIIIDRHSKDFVPGLFGSTENTTGLDDILKAINTAKENEKILGIYLKIGNLSAGAANVEPIRNALNDFKESGKFVFAYADFYSQNAYYLSSIADVIAMNPQGMLMFHGLATNTQFSKGLYEKLGIRFEVFRVGAFKSAIEPMTETQMSDASRKQTDSYVNCIWTYLLNGISESRGISVDNLNIYADEYMSFSAPQKSIEYKLVDTLIYVTDVNDFIKNIAGLTPSEKIRYATVSNINSIPEKKSFVTQDKVAVLYAEGPIMHGKSRGFAPIIGNMITDYEYVKELRSLKNDENVKAVVFRINSPGGSAYASEQIWNAVEQLKQEKPVIVSMGNVAASGGYYIACGANYIVAEPTTITGSIGVFGLIPEGVEMHNKLGLTFDGVKTNKHSDMNATSSLPLISSLIRPYNDEERWLLQSYVNRIYDVFLSRCARGRMMTNAEIDSIGQGRVWTGTQALQIGLIDRLGSLDDAIEIAAQHAQLIKYEVEVFPKVKDKFTRLVEEMMSANMKSTLIKSLLGDEVYRQYIISNNKIAPMDFVQAIMMVE